MLGAYRLYIKNTNAKTRTKLTKYINENYKSKQYFIKEYKTLLNFYVGIKPKDLNIKREKDDILPVYEEFILSECKFGYTYRTTKTIIMTECNKWITEKYPDYIFTKDDKIHFESYLSRNFYNCLKVHLQGGVNGYYGIQMKNDDTIKVGLNLAKAIKINKINIDTNEIIESFNSITAAACNINTDGVHLKRFIESETIIDGCKFVYENLI